MVGVVSLLFFQSLELSAPASDFILGADVSWVQQQEEEGRHFSTGGTNQDFLALMRGHGFNWIRLRLFNDPQAPAGYSAQGYCDLPHTIAMARRARVAGLQLLLDFHYSDTWADPGHQRRPLAWRDLDDAALERAVGEYTAETLRAFKAADALPAMVQIGNEISNGFLWPPGASGRTNRAAFFAELKSGCAAVRAVDPQIRILLHLACGGDNAKSRWFFDEALRADVPFDVIGQSYYPRWHGTVDALRSNLTDLATRYRKPIVVAEYSAPNILDVNRIVHGLPDGLGLGTFIWEPTNWPHGGEPALFDRGGAAKPELDLYPALAREFQASSN